MKENEPKRPSSASVRRIIAEEILVKALDELGARNGGSAGAGKIVIDVDELCRDNPGIAVELRELAEDWRNMLRALGGK